MTGLPLGFGFAVILEFGGLDRTVKDAHNRSLWIIG